MSNNRRGESGTVPNRHERFKVMSNGWYFAVRDGKFEGPYDNVLEAKKALTIYLRRMGIVRQAS
jgi:hypothetical protein